MSLSFDAASRVILQNIIVLKYSGHPEAIMKEAADGNGSFTEAVLKPEITVLDDKMISQARNYQEANRKCFIANSVNFPVKHQPQIIATE